MKIIPLTKDDARLLQAAHQGCKDAEAALDRAHKQAKLARQVYQTLLDQLAETYKVPGALASDDQNYLWCRPSALPSEPEPEV